MYFIKRKVGILLRQKSYVFEVYSSLLSTSDMETQSKTSEEPDFAVGGEVSSTFMTASMNTIHNFGVAESMLNKRSVLGRHLNAKLVSISQIFLEDHSKKIDCFFSYWKFLLRSSKNSQAF